MPVIKTSFDKFYDWCKEKCPDKKYSRMITMLCRKYFNPAGIGTSNYIHHFGSLTDHDLEMINGIGKKFLPKVKELRDLAKVELDEYVKQLKELEVIEKEKKKRESMCDKCIHKKVCRMTEHVVTLSEAIEKEYPSLPYAALSLRVNCTEFSSRINPLGRCLV